MRRVAVMVLTPAALMVVAAPALAADEPPLESVLDAPAGFTLADRYAVDPIDYFDPDKADFVAAEVEAGFQAVWSSSKAAEPILVTVMRLRDADQARLEWDAVVEDPVGMGNLSNAASVPGVDFALLGRSVFADGLGVDTAMRIVGRDLLAYAQYTPPGSSVSSTLVEAVQAHDVLLPSYAADNTGRVVQDRLRTVRLWAPFALAAIGGIAHLKNRRRNPAPPPPPVLVPGPAYVYPHPPMPSPALVAAPTAFDGRRPMPTPPPMPAPQMAFADTSFFATPVAAGPKAPTL